MYTYIYIHPRDYGCRKLPRIGNQEPGRFTRGRIIYEKELKERRNERGSGETRKTERNAICSDVGEGRKRGERVPPTSLIKCRIRSTYARNFQNNEKSKRNILAGLSDFASISRERIFRVKISLRLIRERS